MRCGVVLPGASLTLHRYKPRKWSLPHSREFSMGMFTVAFDFNAYDQLMHQEEVDLCIERGKGVLLYQSKVCTSL